LINPFTRLLDYPITRFGGHAVEFGKGPPLVLIPGIQGRWEYLRPAIDALAASFRTLTFPLCGERGCGAPLDPALGIDNDARQIAEVLDRSGVDRAIICGISFGGLPAIRFAAVAPERTAALILASVPGPHWHLRPRHRVYARAPWLFGPLFLAESPWRLRGEVRSALPRVDARWRFVRGQLGTLLRARISPTRMARRAALISSPCVFDDCARIVAPTLVVTGEPGLDRIVRVDGTLAYVQLIAGARQATLGRTGHLGSITRPDAFASLVREFVEHSWGPGSFDCRAGSFDARPDPVEGRDQGSSDAA
jgi:3-oxoadipate enol-lactonase